MAAQACHFRSSMSIEYADGFIAASAHDSAPIELYASNAFLVTWNGLETLTCSDVPNLNVAVTRCRDYLVVQNLNRINCCRVPVQSH